MTSALLLGTGIALYGSANCTFSITYDKKTQKITNKPQRILFSTFGSNRASHTITLKANPSNVSEVLAFTGAIVTSEVNSTYVTFIRPHSN